MSFSQLVQDLIGGAVRRHIFTPCELEFLLDLQTCHVRKSARPEVLRRYLKAVQQQSSAESPVPLRFLHFLEQEQQQRTAPVASARGATAAAVPCAT